MGYATAVARLIYWRVPRPLPAANNLDGLAAYWKTHYNTRLGDGREPKFVQALRKHGR